jgi:hypothetical protein
LKRIGDARVAVRMRGARDVQGALKRRDRRHDEVRRRRRVANEGHVDDACEDRLGDVSLRRAREDGHRLRMSGAQARERPCGEARDERLDRRDAHLTDIALIVHGQKALVDHAHRDADRGDQVGARVAQGDAAPAAGEQGLPELILEEGDRARDRGGRHAEHGSGARDVLKLGNRAEGGQVGPEPADPLQPIHLSLEVTMGEGAAPFSARQ